ncbi:hypothetical protein Mapa_005829 [Marchantia paleacea]|nr:hypothetical protein Mapa_005829 [Marchantia paleacea]
MISLLWFLGLNFWHDHWRWLWLHNLRSTESKSLHGQNQLERLTCISINTWTSDSDNGPIVASYKDMFSTWSPVHARYRPMHLTKFCVYRTY